MNLQQYILKRLLVAIPTLLAISLLVFSATRLMPGDTVDSQLAEAGGSLSEDDLDRLRSELGLDEPFVQQYFTWLAGIVTGDLGESLWSGRPVSESLSQSLPVTAELAIVSLVISTLISFPLGIVAAVNRNGPLDLVSRFLSLLGLSVPSFFSATLVLVALSKYLGWIPPLSYRSVLDDPWHNAQQMVLPSVILGYVLAAAGARMLRSSLIEVLAQDYVRTARAKGLRGRSVLLVHALRNALIPTVTVISLQFMAIMGGVVVIESIFALPGMGNLLLEAVRRRDYPVIQGVVLVISITVVAVNLLVDVTYTFLDPRVRVS
jgi:peptide/nickel transport system permease protein